TWDVELAARMGAALAGEARAKGAHVLLGPTINLQRDPLGGRHFECLSEDPHLTAHLATAYVRALQARGVAACTKHLVANDAEDDRFEVSSDVDERTLREVSLLPFEHALREAGSWSVMSAYNRLNGTHCSEHRWLLTEVLRDEWGWDGAVISDWFGTRSTVGAARAGLDLEMPGPAAWFGEALARAIRAGEVPLEEIRAKHDHLRLLARRTGATTSPPGPDGPGGGRAVEVASDVAAAAAVLLRNEGGVLPLDPEALRRVAVLGPNADREVVGGGGSARLTPLAVTTVLDGLRARLGDDVVVHAPGCRADRGTPAIDGRHARRADGTAGVDVEVRDAGGAVRLALRPHEFRTVLAGQPWPDAPADGWSLRASCRYEPERSGAHLFKLKTNCTAQLRIDGDVVVDTLAGAREGTVELLAGMPAAFEVTAAPPPSGSDVFRFALELRAAPPPLDDGIAEAAALAAGADAAVVVIGLDGEWETEGRDRDDLALPGPQVELARAVAAAQPRTAVVVLAGAPVDVRWAGEIPALLWGWFPGQEGGTALAAVLTGDRDAAGRLPCTLPVALEDTLAGVGGRGSGHVPYREGVFTGHRRYDRDGIEPAFPFGFGLSYTTFDVGAPVASAGTLAPGDAVTVRIEVTNTGARHGVETVQLYVRDVEASVERPAQELRGFAKVALEPGATGTATIRLGPRDLAFWDDGAGCWRAESGTFELLAARSSRHVVGSTTVELTEDWVVPASWWG
ncbi:MAG TPA: glycoside hydrolase family 3 C-terminal domain-containing protein, partial [Acidimicrobiales bacterium]|nr:glycoside hydrolase family 3 C-terminal domain-containing protein [Acidimicrobiales bacterium]